MIKKTLYFGNPIYLSLKNAQLVIKLPEVVKNETLTGGFKQKAEVTKPIEDIGVVVLDNKQITITSGVLEALLENNCAIITCDSKSMTDYSKITALYSRLSVGDEDRDGGESNSIQNQKKFLESYARQLKLTNIRHYIDDDESGRFFDRSAYSRMMDDVENGKIGVCIMKDLTRWGRDYLQVGNAMEIFRRNNVRFIAVNNGIDSEKPDTLEFAPFINIMSEWYAKDISKKVKTGIKTKGMSGKPIV